MTDDISRAKALYEEGVRAFRAGNEAETTRLSQQALDIGYEIGDPATIVRGLIGLSRVAFRSGDHQQLCVLCEEAEQHWSLLADRAEVTSPIHMMAESARMLGELERARGLYERSISVSREENDTDWVAVELNNMALLELQAGNPDAAERATRESLSLREPGRMDAAYALLSFGAVAAARGEGTKAARWLAASEKLLADEDSIYDPGDKPLFDRSVDRAKQACSAREFDAAWAAGRSLTFEQAVAEVCAT